MDISSVFLSQGALVLLVGLGVIFFLSNAFKGVVKKVMLGTGGVFVAVGTLMAMGTIMGISITPFAVGVPAVIGEPPVDMVINPEVTGNVTFYQNNRLNSTGTEYIAGTVHILNTDDTYAGSVTIAASSAGGSWTEGVYGQSYKYVVLSTDNALPSTSGTFRLGKPSTVQLKPAQIGTTTFRVYDIDNDAFMYDTGDASNVGFEASGITFSSTTDNATETTIGLGGVLRLRVDMLQTASDTSTEDVKNYLAFDGDFSDWKPDEVSIVVNGVTLQPATMASQLTSDGYETIYEMPQAVEGATITSAYVTVSSAGGVNPDADIKMALVKSGVAVHLTNPLTTTTGIVESDGRTYTHALQSLTVQVQ